MKNLVLIVSILFSMASQASPELKVGDILLQPLDCWTCDLIEAEENTIYSHIGIVVSVNPVLVADSRRKVEKQPFEVFNSITQKGQQIRVLRFQNEKIVAALETKSAEFQKFFDEEFAGLAYDHQFLWNNLDENGSQKLYCSEMIAKLLQAFLGIDPIVKRMHFDQNTDQWARYFKGDIPEGKWGNAPADFERSDLFYVVGDL
jgi:hypothetical protein